MAERCPLSPGEIRIEDIPDTCRQQCFTFWERALKEQSGVVDWYGTSKEDCNHELYEVTHSHQALQRLAGDGGCSFSLVDMCEGCEQELMETGYEFDCPYSN